MSDVVVVGGGVIGMLTSRELAKAGLKVTLIEKGGLGGESSWAGGGILSPLYPWRYHDAVNQMARWSQDQYQDLARQLESDTGVDPEWQQSGLLVLDTDETDQARQWADHYGVNLRRLGREAIVSAEPSLGKLPDQALLLPDIAHIRNPRLLKCLKKSIESLGVKVLEKTEVSDLITDSVRITGVLVGGEFLPASRVVVACGAWSAKLLKGIVGDIDIRPVRGQMLLFKAVPGLVKHMILDQGRYIIPRRDGHVLVGSTLEYVDFDKSTTAEARESLLETAYSLVPSLVDYELVKHWAGLRPGTADGIPYIGAHPEYEGLYINAGHFRNGLVLGPSSVRLLVELMLESPTHIDATMYSIAR